MMRQLPEVCHKHQVLNPLDLRGFEAISNFVPTSFSSNLTAGLGHDQSDQMARFYLNWLLTLMTIRQIA